MAANTMIQISLKMLSGVGPNDYEIEEDATIAKLKNVIQELHGIDPAQLQIVFQGMLLDLQADAATLKHCGVTDGAVLELVSLNILILSGGEIYLRTPSHKNHFLECNGREGRGFGVYTGPDKRRTWRDIETAKFLIRKWDDSLGALQDGDEIYLRNPSHENHYVECHNRVGRGFGVSTGLDKTATWGDRGEKAKFTIHKWSGIPGSLRDGDEIFIRCPSHENHYVECHARGGRGFAVSTGPDKETTWGERGEKAKFTIHKWNDDSNEPCTAYSAS